MNRHNIIPLMGIFTCFTDRFAGGLEALDLSSHLNTCYV